MIHQDYANLRKIVSGDITVKCRYGTDVRRIPISQAPSYDELCLMMYRLYKNKLSNPEDIVLKYTDDEGDLISMTDDMDVSYAISQSPLLKITVFDKTDDDHSPPGPSMQELKAEVEKLIGMLKSLMEAPPPPPPPSQNQSGSSVTKGKVPENAYRPLSTAELAEFLGDQQKLSNNEGKTKPVQQQQQQQTSNQSRPPPQQAPAQQHQSTPSQQVAPYPPLPPTSYPPPPMPQQQSPYGLPPPSQPQQQQQQQLPPTLPPSANGGNSYPPQPVPGTPQTPVNYPPEQQQYPSYRVSAPSAPPSNQYYYPPPPQQLQQAPPPPQQRPQGWN